MPTLFEPDQDLALLASDAEEPVEQLLIRIQNGDEGALATLHARHHRLFRTVIGRMINNEHDVDDLIQECLLEVWRRAGNYYVEKGNGLGWIMTLIRRRTIDRIRRKTAYGRVQDRFRVASAALCENTQSGADEEVEQSERGTAVSHMVSRLPVAQQEVVRLAFYQGLSQREIAAQTGIPLGTIKTRIELGLQKLRAAVLVFGELYVKQPAGV